MIAYRSRVGTMFCLPWLITWFAHTIPSTTAVVRLYDFLLASPPLMAMYVAAAVVVDSREEVLAGECEMSAVHMTLSKVIGFAAAATFGR